MGIAFALAIPPMVMLNPDKLGKEEAATATTPPRLPENEWSYYRLLRHPMFAINLLTAIILSLLANFDGPTLEPYLSQFNLTNAEIGTVFTANYVANCGGSLFAGVISSYKVEKLSIFVGCILSTLSYVIIGPAPFLPHEPTLMFVYVAQVIKGIGASAMEVCVYTGVLRYIVEIAGYPNTIQTNGFVASIVHQSTIITNIAIPPSAGYLASTYGYRNGTMFIFAILSIWTIVTGFVWLKSECRRFGTDRTQYNVLPQDDLGHYSFAAPNSVCVPLEPENA
ncbi:uncharacterized protein LOC115321362 [Ixodes scapularis]|uniref:uncharacterized protein LOC115321362 n=1 Tax=Ixodes scapularis TaxID=6945 RepID=UPI001A9E796D|nr:uncharacterized protein LOC115321362 [Ixodes scapularis]